MAIKWFNIRSKEVRVAETEPHIAAMWGSSDHGPNAMQGQDFGWRLAPEVVVEMRRIKTDLPTLESIAIRIKKSVEELTEPDILMYISSKSTSQSAPVATLEDYRDEYDAEIRRLERQEKKGQKSAKADEEPALEADAE